MINHVSFLDAQDALGYGTHCADNGLALLFREININIMLHVVDQRLIRVVGDNDLMSLV